MSDNTIDILLVEDNPGDIFFIRKLLHKGFGAQINLTTVEYLSDAVTRIGLTHFDVCLLDLNLPDSQGLNSLQTLQEINPQMPIVMLTSLDDEDTATQALQLGGQDYLVKDQINQTWLKQAIHHAIERALLIEKIRASERQKQQLILLLRDRLDRRTTAIQKMHQQVKSLRILSSIDPLTQITNRLGFDKRLKHEWVCNVGSGTPLSLLMIDIDFFKQFNDTYGHHSGDLCLKQVAQGIKDSLHRPRDLVARYGGEEFVVILPDTSAEGAMRVATSILENVRVLEIPHPASKICNWVTISLGFVTTIPDASDMPQDLIVKADHALYEAKHKGRNRFSCYQSIYERQTSVQQA